MARHLDHWLNRYVELMYNTEPAKLFDIWTGYSVISAALRRKVYLQLGRLTYYPNIYTVFVADPGVARKTQAIKFGVELLTTIPEIIMSSDSATKEALTDDIFASRQNSLMPDGTEMAHSSINIISKEFESFLGQKKENTRMIMALTDLYDCPEQWSSRTRHSGSTKIEKPWPNLLAATTPDSLASSLPASAVGGGLTSRMLFVWADKKKRSVAIPSMTPKELKLKDDLIKDLYVISRIAGEYVMTADCINHWQEWYDKFDEDESGIRICTDKAFNGWYSRKPTYIIKIAMLRAAAEADTRVVQWKHMEEAMAAIKEVELVMGNAFRAIGKSEITAEVDTVYQIVKAYGWISEKNLMTLVYRDIDSDKFLNVIETIIKTGRVKRSFGGPNKEPGIWYKSTE
jgi:hypothetical protein